MVIMNNNGSILLSTLMFVMNQSYIQDENSYNYYFMRIGKETKARKCYGIYGCFELSSPWTSENRPVSLFPNDLHDIEPNYLLYTRKNRYDYFHLNLNDHEYILHSPLNPLQPIYVITHGYMEGGSIEWIYNTAQELLNLEDCNVIAVDWHGGSSPPYTQAVANIRLIGSMTAHLLHDIAQYTSDLKLDHVHCIGHSLGAHLCGYVGYTLQDEFNLTLGRITGLDPADPHFAKTSRPVRLDKSAAKYVDVIHTDASQFIRGGLGISESIGHVDYFPNGGSNQPGCGKSIVQFIHDQRGSFFNGMKKYLSCNHERAHQLFLASINPKCSFLTVSCESFQDFLDGKCWDCGKHGEKCLRFGYLGHKHYTKFYHRLSSTSMRQYLLTSTAKPYCRGHYKISVKVSNNEESRKHGGEIGQLMISMHSALNGNGIKTPPVGFISGFYEPGGSYSKVIAADEIKLLRSIEIEWRYNSSLFNPLTWRILTTPMIYLTEVVVESLENQQRVQICPKDKKPLIAGIPQLFFPSYC